MNHKFLCHNIHENLHYIEYLEAINKILKSGLKEIDLRRFDINDQEINLVYYLKAEDPKAEVST